MSSPTPPNDSHTQSPPLEHTIATLSSHLTQTTTHRTTLLLALHKHFTLPLLTMRPASRLITAYTRLSHVLRKMKHRLSHTVVIAPAVLREVRLVGDALTAILRDGALLVANIQRLATNSPNDVRDGEKHVAARLQSAKAHLVAQIDEAKKRRRVRGEVSERMAVLEQRVVRLRRKAVKAVRK